MSISHITRFGPDWVSDTHWGHRSLSIDFNGHFSRNPNYHIYLHYSYNAK